MEVVDEMIEEANADWEAIQTDEEALEERPLPLIRLKVEYTAPEGGLFECENPQRFSNRFVGKVANTNDVVYFYRKKSSQRKATAATPADALEAITDEGDMVKVESLVQEFLSAQSLKVLPQGPFGDAVNQFVSKDDKHAMELFVSEHLTGQVKQLLGLESDEEDLNSAMEIYRTRIEHQMASSGTRQSLGERRRVLRPKPDTWDSDFDGNWEEEPDAWTYEGVSMDMTPATTQGRPGRSAQQDEEMLDDDDEPPAKTTRRTAGRATKATTAKAPAKKAPAKKPAARGRGRKAVQSEDEEEDVVMEAGAAAQARWPNYKARADASAGGDEGGAQAASKGAAAKTKQTKLDFASQRGATQDRALEISDDEVSDGEDAFEPAPIATRTRRR
ncbi:hypothetical protein ACCO45_004649 [Purpureocillium lilacinum]|uniref:Uncharacterized protein n=1 Tax=Purpureocillium lilacinum TaxID=33203 RepID=A0ACC4DTV6_PURLI